MFKPVLFWLSLFMPAALLAASASSPMKMPAEAERAEAGELVERMKERERGPYSRIRWYCNDGSVLPPEPFACSARGGGRQHAEYAPERQRLAELGWHVGTIVAALSWEEFWGVDPRHLRLRELPMERFMFDYDDGWVLRKAQNYRGRVQIEDEEQAGRALLLRLLGQGDWVQDNFLLVRKIVETLPHGGVKDRTQRVRQSAQELAEQDASFNRLRIEIHSRPNPGSAGRVRAWLAVRPEISSDLSGRVEQLAADLDALFGVAGRQERLKKAEQSLSTSLPAAAKLLATARGTQGAGRITALTRAMMHIREHVPARDPVASLYRLDLLQALEAEMRVASLELLQRDDLDRRALVQLSIDLLNAAWASGLLSVGERMSLYQPLATLLQETTAAGSDYAQAARRLSLAAAWSAMTIRYTFAEALLRYNALDAHAERFVDEQLRGSVLLPLGEVAHRLALDGAAVAGLSHHFFGDETGQLLGINPGVARGRLRFIDTDELARGVQPAMNEIVVLPETVAELTPVAGILTLGEGNPLSHVQMLARNLGIPNVVVDPGLLKRLRAEHGTEVMLAVAADGRVYLERQAELPAELAEERRSTVEQSESLVLAPAPGLAHRDLLPLADLHAGLSGKVVGPKAANVGELARRFPGRIAPAIALPFALFADYTGSQRQQVAVAYEKFRAGELDQAGLDAVLDRVRGEIAAVQLEPGLRADLRRWMTQEFGQAEDYGVFVRSDTNVEDLPGFTGAGLNETVPNVVGFDAQLAAIPRVWSSVYSRRAMAWRGRILQNPDQVFASVLLMKSIPAQKSGVLVTRDLAGAGEGMTVSVAWGVGGAVDNESAATRVLRADGSSQLLAEAKAPYRRALNPEGGVYWLPAPSGPVLTAAEELALRELAAEVVKGYPAVLDDQGDALPWDIEFAFTEDKLWLLQIRPLVQRGHIEAARVISKLLPPPSPMQQVQLDRVPLTRAGE